MPNCRHCLVVCRTIGGADSIVSLACFPHNCPKNAFAWCILVVPAFNTLGFSRTPKPLSPSSLMSSTCESMNLNMYRTSTSAFQCSCDSSSGMIRGARAHGGEVLRNTGEQPGQIRRTTECLFQFVQRITYFISRGFKGISPWSCSFFGLNPFFLNCFCLTRCRGKAQLVFNLYTVKTRKQSLWSLGYRDACECLWHEICWECPKVHFNVRSGKPAWVSLSR